MELEKTAAHQRKKDEKEVRNKPGSPEGSAELGFISEEGLKKDQQDEPNTRRSQKDLMPSEKLHTQWEELKQPSLI